MGTRPKNYEKRTIANLIMRTPTNIAYLFCILLLFTAISDGLAQKKKKDKRNTTTADFNEELTNELLENLASDSEDADIDFDTFYETLSDLQASPLAINTASFEDLSELPISSQQLNSVLEYREKYGDITSIYELQAIPGIDAQTAMLLANFVQVDAGEKAKTPIGRMLFGGKNQLLLRYQRTLEDQKAFLPVSDTVGPKFLGGPERIYARYRYNFGTRLSYGITAEKDPGEEFFRGTQKRGFDFYSAHFYINNVGPVRHLALGDYEIRLGQGLVAWSGLGFRKGSYVLDIIRKAKPIKPYTSVDENNFYRGVAANIGSNNLNATIFASYKPIDANLVEPADTTIETTEGDDATGEDGGFDTGVTSLQSSGFHRTESELFDRDAVNQLHLGGGLKYRGSNYSIGVNALYMRLDTTLRSSQQAAPHNLYRFEGNSLLNASVDYRLVLPHINLFGEVAFSDNGGFAILNGALFDLDKHIQLSVLHRHYSAEYQSLNSGAFAESSAPNNERGIYFGARIQPIPKWSLKTYYDMYRHPWLKFLTDAPSHGADFLAELEYKHSRRVNMYLRYRNEVKKKNAVGNETASDYLTNHEKMNLRYNIKYKIGNGFVLQSRVEISRYNNGVDGPEKGYVVLQDINYRPSNLPFTISSRFALFDTDTYNARIYAYENDVLYAFNVPPYFNKGSRFYIVGKYEISRNFTCWLRFGQTYFANQDVISSGDNEIQGRTKSEVKAMLRVKF